MVLTKGRLVSCVRAGHKLFVSVNATISYMPGKMPRGMDMLSARLMRVVGGQVIEKQAIGLYFSTPGIVW